jgi:hypothetical protein
MISNGLTYIISIVALISYFSYIVVRHGTLGFLFSSAIFLLIAAFVDHIEYITIGLLIVGLTLSILIQQRVQKAEGFEEEEAKEEPKEEDAEGFEEDEEKKEGDATPGVLSQTNIDSFDATGPNSNTPPATSTPADANAKPAVDQQAIAKGVTDALAQLQTSVQNTKAATQPSAATKAGSNENFQEPSAGLFKLGELPSEMKKGPFVDVASTMSKAMGSLNTDQMAAMTAESQSLMETQKNLMGMLKSMGPVLQDGRQLLDTFNGIFGSLGGLGGGLQGKA